VITGYLNLSFESFMDMRRNCGRPETNHISGGLPASLLWRSGYAWQSGSGPKWPLDFRRRTSVVSVSAW